MDRVDLMFEFMNLAKKEPMTFYQRVMDEDIIHIALVEPINYLIDRNKNLSPYYKLQIFLKYLKSDNELLRMACYGGLAWLMEKKIGLFEILEESLTEEKDKINKELLTKFLMKNKVDRIVDEIWRNYGTTRDV